MKNNPSFQNCSNSAHEPCNAAVSAASSRGVPPREGTRGGTPRELAGGDACATTAASVQGFDARNVRSGNSLLGERVGVRASVHPTLRAALLTFVVLVCSFEAF